MPQPTLDRNGRRPVPRPAASLLCLHHPHHPDGAPAGCRSASDPQIQVQLRTCQSWPEVVRKGASVARLRLRDGTLVMSAAPAASIWSLKACCACS